MRPCPSALRSRRPSFPLLAWLVLSVTSSCSAYEYIGTVTFSNEAGSSQAASSSSSSSPPPPPRPQPTSASSLSSSSSRTLLVTRSGDAFLSTSTTGKPRRGLLQEITSISEDALEIAKAAMHTASAAAAPAAGPLFKSERRPVADTELFPFSAVGMLVGGAPATAPSGTPGLACSGALISRRHVLTAAHCVFDLKNSTSSSSRAFVSSLDFYPARSGARTPLGRASISPVIPWKSVRVMEAFVAQGSYNAAAMNLDFALVTLDRDADASAGWLSLQDPGSPPPPPPPPPHADGDAYDPFLITTAGYPTGLNPSHAMWTSCCAPSSGRPFFDMAGTDAAFAGVDECSSSTSACSNIGAHSCQSTHGQSGSPMWLGKESGRVVAVLTGSATSTAAAAAAASPADPAAAAVPPTPVATKISPLVFSTLLSWAAEDPGGAGPLAAAPSGQMPRRQAPPGEQLVDVLGLGGLDLRSPRGVALVACASVAACVILLCFCYLCVARPGLRALRRARERRAEIEAWNTKRGGGGGGGGASAGAVVSLSANSSGAV